MRNSRSGLVDPLKNLREKGGDGIGVEFRRNLAGHAQAHRPAPQPRRRRLAAAGRGPPHPWAAPGGSGKSVAGGTGTLEKSRDHRMFPEPSPVREQRFVSPLRKGRGLCIDGLGLMSPEVSPSAGAMRGSGLGRKARGGVAGTGATGMAGDGGVTGSTCRRGSFRLGKTKKQVGNLFRDLHSSLSLRRNFTFGRQERGRQDRQRQIQLQIIHRGRCRIRVDK